MSDMRVQSFINALIAKTKNKEIRWGYLDSNRTLYERMSWVRDDFLGIFQPDFDVEDSFYVSIDGTYVVLYVPINAPACLYVIPNTFRKIRCFEPEEYGSLITRLHNVVQGCFPSADQFIKDFISQRFNET